MDAARRLSAEDTVELVELKARVAALEQTIAQHRQVEDELRVTQARLQRLLAATPGIIFSYRPGGDFATTFVSGSVAAVLGYEPVDFLRRPSIWPTIVHPDDLPAIHANRSRLLAEGHLRQVYRIRHQDGSYRWLHEELLLVRASDGGPREIVGVSVDITERKRHEETQRLLAEAGTLLAASLDLETTLRQVVHLALPSLGDACVIDLIQDDGTIRQIAVAPADPALTVRILEVRRRYPLDPAGAAPPARVLRSGQPLLIAEVPPTYSQEIGRDATHRALIEGLAVRSIICVPLRARDRTLGTLSFVISGSRRRYTPADLALADELARRAALAVDNARLYGEAQAALAALRQSQAQLVQAGKLAAIGTLAAGIAHEFSQPLMVIRGQAQLLRGDPASSEPLRRRAERIERQTDHLAEVIDHIRTFGRASPDAPGRPVELNQAVRGALLLLGAQFRERGVELQLDLAEPSPVALADANQVERIVLNLLLNARDALGQGGAVVVRTWGAADGCRLSIADSGPGIPEEVLPRVFEPFFTTKDHGQGTGLGLSIARDLARRWGGTLTLANRADRPGAVAELILPPAARRG